MKLAISHPEVEESVAPVTFAMEVIGGKYKALILLHLMSGTLRFNELRRLLPEASQRVMTLNLRELEADGIIDRKIHQTIPPKVEYSLTPLGRTLMPLIETMRNWGVDHVGEIEAIRSAESHAASFEVREKWSVR